jgi:Rrf2 family protein
MKLSSHEEYGLRCLLQIGRQGSLTIPEISKAEGISSAYVGKLMGILRRGGFVKSVRGKAGGYTLARPSDKTVVGEVLATLGGRFYQPGFCEGHSGREEACTHTTDCAVRSLWRAVQGALDQILSETTLQDLLQRTEREMTSWVTVSKLNPSLKQFNLLQ